MLSKIKTLRLHKLKTLPPYYLEVIRENKKFELRKDDRDYQKGDILILQEYSQESGKTGEMAFFKVTYIFRGSGKYGLEKGYSILSISPLSFDLTLALEDLKLEKYGDTFIMKEEDLY